MSNEAFKTRKAWFELLDGNISVPVYGGDVPKEERGHHVQLRVESDIDGSNNQTFVSNPVIISEVVTRFETMIDDGVAPGIDREIKVLLFPIDPAHHALPVQDDIQIVSVQRRDATYIQEDDGSDRYLRLITRNVHRVIELQSQS